MIEFGHTVHISLSNQADTKPGCVLRPANVIEVLQRKRNLLTNEDVETCKSGMNTWAFVGDLNDHPQLSCVYQSDDAQNEFLSNPKVRRHTRMSFGPFFLFFFLSMSPLFAIIKGGEGRGE